MVCLLSKLHLLMVEKESPKACKQDENASDSKKESSNEDTTNVSQKAECGTPKKESSSLKRSASESSVTIVDLVKSPKRHKQSIGNTPFSRMQYFGVMI